MDTERTIQIDTAIFDSQSALEEYLLNVRSRRENRRKNRIEFQRLNLAILAVKKELAAARQDDDIDIAEELNLVLQEFERRLANLECSPLVIDVPLTIIENSAPASDRRRDAPDSQHRYRHRSLCSHGLPTGAPYNLPRSCQQPTRRVRRPPFQRRLCGRTR